MTRGSTVLTEPYVGPRPFETHDRDLFFGRERESYEIKSLILASKFFMLYAASGAGKTSLVNAGVLPLVSDELDVLPTARFQTRVSAAPADVSNVYAYAALSCWADQADLDKLGQTTLTEFLAARPRTHQPIGAPKPRLLVFDQFEELFTTHAERWRDRRAFLEQLAEASRSHPDLRVLLVLREDFLSRLLAFADSFNGGLKDRYFLEPLRYEAAEMAIANPLQGTDRSIQAEAVDDLVRKLMTVRVDVGESRVVQLEGEFVEPVLLQVVCQKLWAELPPDVTVITPANIRDVNTSLADFYSDAVKKAAGLGLVTERRIREWVQENLLTHPGGTRGTVHVGSETTAGLPNEVVELLVGTLLRAEFRAGARWLEITHDSLLGPIEISNADFFRADGPLAREADTLALAMTRRWQAEARARRLNDPYPLPVRWTPADPSLADTWEEIEKLASSVAGWPQQSSGWATGPAELADGDASLASTLARVPSHRLVLLGGPGAGKTTLLVRLMLDLLASRLRGGPVPMLVSAASWDPAAQSLTSWLARQLSRTASAMAAGLPGESMTVHIEALLTAGLILPILDGLDELPAISRRTAIIKINETLQPGDPLILSCRTQQYEQAVRPLGDDRIVLRAAAALELRPLSAGAIAHYLRDTAGGLVSAARWDPVTALLGSNTPVSEALATPLMTVLARTIYNPREGYPPGEQRDPAELCDSEYIDRARVEEQLLTAFVAAAYSTGTSSRWTLKQSEHWLALLAAYAESTADGISLAWWQFTRVMPRGVLGLLSGSTTALILALALRFALGASWLYLSAAASVVFGAAMATCLATERNPSGGLRWNAWRAVPAGLVIGVLTGIIDVRIFGISSGIKAALISTLAFGLAAGLEGIPGHRFWAGAPRAVLGRDRRTAIITGAVPGTAIGIVIGLVFGTVHGPVAGIVLGTLSAAVMGFAAMCDEAVWPQWQLARIWLFMRFRLPRQLITFLDDARDRAVLRQVGSVYQFRHLQLQHLLASQSTAAHGLTARTPRRPRRPSSADPRLGLRMGSRPVATIAALAVCVSLLVSVLGAAKPKSSGSHHLPKAWKHATSASVDASPTVTGGMVYIADDDGTIYALNAVTGKEAWTYSTGSQIGSRPAVANGTVYVGNDASKFLALDAANGEVRWIKTFSGGIDSSPTVARGIVYIGDGDNYLHALNAVTGAQLWRYPTGAIAGSSPRVHAGVVYVGGEDGNVYAFKARTGRLLWAARTGGAVNSSPAIAGRALYIGNDNHDIYALNAGTGRIIWVRKTGGPVGSSPAVAHGIVDIVYVGSNDGKVYCLDAVTGRIIWVRQTGGPVESSPAVAYGTVYVGSNDGKIYALDAATGEITWSRRTGGDVISSPAIARRRVYVGSDNDEILALDAAKG